ncbi:uncharacterized protein C8Q71DRAFT_86499 [Rhodofomes roseus]|uniref:Large ribosomal subunit protein bL32m n=1 Tax=Rhodofomes roseus TaxID=34475 RepID=A0ABQ8KE40_9APHY|nr:uncharacterized protein C8Q71DRAFT_86499 [Rhodofomes roseus]KAH9835588.1 hypothetical protein C8Q71DRAFT_86499 [Rhodofomes roseus]
MAAIALQQSRMLWPSLRVPFSRPLLSAAALLPAFLPRSFEWRLPSLASVLELFPPFLLAVPKKKTSHSRKAMRSANKGLHDKRNLVHCPGCGSPKLAHNLCPECYSTINRAWKAKSKQGGGSGDDIPTIGTHD